MEKIDYLMWRVDGFAIADHRETLVDHCGRLLDRVLALTLFVADTDEDVPKPTLLMGRGPDLAAVASVWVDSIDDREAIEEALCARGANVDGYLVTESVPQHREPPRWHEITHFTWFPKPDRLTDEQFFHGWHEVHTPSTQRLHPTRLGYTRDSVARAVTPGSPLVNAIVFEYFALKDYLDPRKLYGSREAVDETVQHLPLYADYESINSRPLHELIVKAFS